MTNIVRIIFGGLFSIFLVNSASALSCMPPSITSSFHYYDQAEESYRAVMGRWRAAEPVPEVGEYNQTGEPRQVIRYRFVGRGIGYNGPTGRYQVVPVNVQPQCAGPWCAGYPANNDNVIVFVEERGDGEYWFTDGPCGGASFAATSENLQSLVNCLNGRRCDDDTTYLPVEPVAPPVSNDWCGAQGDLAGYVGERVERVPFDLWPERARFVRPGDMMTMDYFPNRLNVILTNTAIVERLYCG